MEYDYEWDDKKFKTVYELSLYLMKKDLKRDEVECKRVNLVLKIYFGIICAGTITIFIQAYNCKNYLSGAILCGIPFIVIALLWRKGIIQYIFSGKRK